jgi:hypothetical protein
MAYVPSNAALGAKRTHVVRKINIEEKNGAPFPFRCGRGPFDCICGEAGNASTEARASNRMR